MESTEHNLRQKRCQPGCLTEDDLIRIARDELRRFDLACDAEAFFVHDEVVDEMRQAELAVWIRMQIIKSERLHLIFDALLLKLLHQLERGTDDPPFDTDESSLEQRQQ